MFFLQKDALMLTPNSTEVVAYMQKFYTGYKSNWIYLLKKCIIK